MNESEVKLLLVRLEVIKKAHGLDTLKEAARVLIAFRDNYPEKVVKWAEKYIAAGKRR